MYTIVTGAAGFIGANIVKALNARGVTDILAVDNLSRAEKMPNLSDCDIADYLDKQDFIERVRADRLPAGIAAVLNAYGMSADEATAVSDVMFQTVKRGVLTFGELANTIGTCK